MVMVDEVQMVVGLTGDDSGCNGNAGQGGAIIILELG